MNAAAQVDTQREEYGSGGEGAWVPKVGERVRFVRDSTAGGARYGAAGTTATVKNVWDSIDGPAVSVRLDYDAAQIGFAPAAHVKDLEPVLASAPFRIEAGKFYRTRDGRRVGPMESRDGWGGPFVWQYDRGRLIYRQDGTNFEPGERDLIAEWVDEPTVTTASNDNEAPAKFKVGDRVRVTHTDYPHDIPLGSITHIVKIDSDGDAHLWAKGFPDGLFFYESEFTAVSVNPAIVCLIENGQPRPSAFPRVHADELSASAEASRLAGVHKGKHFGVYVLAQTVSEERPAYKHEWQRLAADGQKIAAIKELRALTGMQLKPAKDVVEHFIYSPYGLAA